MSGAAVAAGVGASILLAAAAAGPFLLLWLEHRRTPIPAGWAPGELAQLRTARPAPAGRHHLVGARAADHISLNIWHVARHAYRHHVPTWWRPAGQPPRWARLAQLRLARRLRAMGVPATWTPGPRGPLP